MPHFFCKLVPPRPAFVASITPEERALMQAHAAYWMPFVVTGKVIAMGPVADAKGDFGFLVAETSDRATLSGLLEKDPVITASAGFSWEISPILGLMTPASVRQFAN